MHSNVCPSVDQSFLSSLFESSQHSVMVHLELQGRLLRGQSSRMSALETSVLVGGASFVERLFDSWPVDAIIRLGYASYILWNVFQGYASVRWNLGRTLSYWFTAETNTLSSLLREASAVVCGPIVSNFFARIPCDSGNLDMCVGEEGYECLVRFLGRQRYRHQPGAAFITAFQPRVDQVDIGFIFRSQIGSDHTVTLHVVQGDPIYFLLSCSSSTSTVPAICSVRNAHSDAQPVH